MNGRVDALLVMSPDIDAQTLAPHLPVHHPVVLMNCRVDHELYDTLAFDNYGGAVQMMKHILHHGHKHIAFLSGRRGNLDAEERLRGYLEAMKDSGLPHSPGLVIPGEFSEASGYEAAKNVISLTPRPTAILAANDSIAIGALSALREAHILVPEDVALTGFDDIPVAAYLSPALTTVHLGIRDLGIRAMEIVLDALQHEEGRARQRRVLSTTLKIRESCGCKSLPHRAMDREGRTGRRTG
jgi:LacI family transcriptional regulator